MLVNGHNSSYNELNVSLQISIGFFPDLQPVRVPHRQS